MTEEDVKNVVENLKKSGMSEGDVIGSMWLLVQNGKISIDQFGALIDTMGYHVNPDLKKMSEEDAKKINWDFGKSPKELPEDEQETDDDDKVDEGKSEKDEGKDDSEDDDRKKALELMGYKD